MSQTRYLRLTADVVNPKPDRRRTEWRAAAVIPAGTPLVLQEKDYTIDPAHPAIVQTLNRSGASLIYDVSPRSHPDLFQRLLDASAPRTPTMTERLDERGISGEEVLEFLGVSDAVLDTVQRLSDERWAARQTEQAQMQDGVHTVPPSDPTEAGPQ